MHEVHINFPKIWNYSLKCGKISKYTLNSSFLLFLKTVLSWALASLRLKINRQIHERQGLYCDISGDSFVSLACLAIMGFIWWLFTPVRFLHDPNNTHTCECSHTHTHTHTHTAPINGHKFDLWQAWHLHPWGLWSLCFSWPLLMQHTLMYSHTNTHTHTYRQALFPLSHSLPSPDTLVKDLVDPWPRPTWHRYWFFLRPSQSGMKKGENGRISRHSQV